MDFAHIHCLISCVSFLGFVICIRLVIFFVTVVKLRGSKWSSWWSIAHVLSIFGVFVVIVLFIFSRPQDVWESKELRS